LCKKNIEISGALFTGKDKPWADFIGENLKGIYA